MDSLGRHTFIPPYLINALAHSGALPPDAVAEMRRIDQQLRQGRATALPQPGDGVASTARWTVHDAQQTETLPGEPVRSEGEPESGDQTVDEAATGITATLDLFRDVFQRESYDGAGARVSLTVHYGTNYANAFWDGSHLVFGDGDGEVFGRFTAAVDVLAHEFSHGVVERTTGFVYQGQSGALNESLSDVFGACVRQRVLGHDAVSADWLVGAGIFLPGIKARALRDMANPGTAYDDPRLGKDPQPAHMDDYVETTDDNGGVHINSGIPNRAFVLAAQAIGGSTAEGAGAIWYSAITGDGLKPDSDFAAFAAATISHAGEHEDAVRTAWEQVGVVPAVAGQPPAPSPGPEPSPATQEVEVRRSGGLLGQTVTGSVDLTSDDPRVPRVRKLAAQCDLNALGDIECEPQPDRYVFDFRIFDAEARVPEQELTPQLSELADLVLRPASGA